LKNEFESQKQKEIEELKAHYEKKLAAQHTQDKTLNMNQFRSQFSQPSPSLTEEAKRTGIEELKSKFQDYSSPKDSSDLGNFEDKEVEEYPYSFVVYF
jgi:hypothetical protein